MNYYSNGRFILGLGSSHRVQVGPEYGQPYEEPLQRLRETVEIVRAILRDGEVSYKGEVIDIERFDFWFQPLRNEIPIYLGSGASQDDPNKRGDFSGSVAIQASSGSSAC